ncbi:carbohydrate ABC transporter substrate-binding protein (CUT1 family) [Stackebrandtia albiflava]|uniref:Carbohydrate ABC transporter substrate-binding protein (CUT1 family) n=1 Tax=Stackebrandtia albiflava TaxID=406432 RepID=A0A562UY25_9ACTN|nr:maltose ABC transporter substrate-binding protein [Stackebrandtia albiflava]TWJ10544.1 carbohydrate ABC transporter substrate-binding protein (CUT1 family) [Stackebrandtia albiflava]
MRTKTATLAVGAALTMALAACGGDAEPQTTDESGIDFQGTLVIWTDEERAESLKPVVQEFADANGIEIEVQGIAENLQDQFVTASEQGEGPDILVQAHDWIGNLVQNGAIEPIPLTEEQQAAMNPDALRAVTYDGQIYGTPYAMENLALIRNTDLAPEAPATIEEMVATGNELKDAGDVEDVLSIEVGKDGNPYNAYPFYASAGGYLFGQDAEGNYDPADLGLAKPEAVDAFEKLAWLGEEGAMKTTMGPEHAIPMFAEGKTAFLVTGPWAMNQIREAGISYDITPIPSFEGGDPATPFIGTQTFFVASKGENKAFAQEFVADFITGADLATKLYESDPRPPVNIEAASAAAESDPDMAKFLAAGEGGYILPAIPEMQAVWEPFGRAHAAVISGDDVEAAVKGAADAIQEAIGA